jgi:hypothetical protein
VLSDKQRFELNAASLFQSASKLLSGYAIIPGDDPPDVIAQYGDHIVGIEVRRMFADERKVGSPQRRHMSWCQRVVSHTQSLHREKTNRWYYVRVRFEDESHVFNDKRVDIIARMLLRHACEPIMSDNESREFCSEDYSGPTWPEEVATMRVTVLPGNCPPDWVLFGSLGWLGDTNSGLVQAGLDSKESSCAAYPPNINERWLLLLCDGSVGSSFLRLHKEMHTESYRSSFNRAFVMDFSGKAFVELHVVGRGMSGGEE